MKRHPSRSRGICCAYGIDAGLRDPSGNQMRMVQAT
jgi:hypothetical protein